MDSNQGPPQQTVYNGPVNIFNGPTETVQGNKNVAAQNLTDKGGEIESSNIRSRLRMGVTSGMGAGEDVPSHSQEHMPRRNLASPASRADSASCAHTTGDGCNSNATNTQRSTVAHERQHSDEIPGTSAMQSPIENGSGIQEESDPGSANDENPVTPLDLTKQSDASGAGEQSDAESDVSRKREGNEDSGPSSKRRKDVDKTRQLFLSKEKRHLYMRQKKFTEGSKFTEKGNDTLVVQTMDILDELECTVQDVVGRRLPTSETASLSKELIKLMNDVEKKMPRIGTGVEDVMELAAIASKEKGTHFRSILFYRIASLLHKKEKNIEGIEECIHRICEVKKQSLTIAEENVYKTFVIPLLKKMPPEVNLCRKTENPNSKSLEEALEDAKIQNSIAKMEILVGQKKEAAKRLKATKKNLEEGFGRDDKLPAALAYEELIKLLNETSDKKTKTK